MPTVVNFGKLSNTNDELYKIEDSTIPPLVISHFDNDELKNETNRVKLEFYSENGKLTYVEDKTLFDNKGNKVLSLSKKDNSTNTVSNKCYLRIPYEHPSNLTFNDKNFRISGWFKWDGFEKTARNQVLFGQGDDGYAGTGSAGSFCVFISSKGFLSLKISTSTAQDSGSVKTLTQNSSILMDNSWHLIELIKNDTDVGLYYDTIKVISLTTNKYLYQKNALTYPFLIGALGRKETTTATVEKIGTTYFLGDIEEFYMNCRDIIFAPTQSKINKKRYNWEPTGEFHRQILEQLNLGDIVYIKRKKTRDLPDSETEDKCIIVDKNHAAKNSEYPRNCITLLRYPTIVNKEDENIPNIKDSYLYSKASLSVKEDDTASLPAVEADWYLTFITEEKSKCLNNFISLAYTDYTKTSSTYYSREDYVNKICFPSFQELGFTYDFLKENKEAYEEKPEEIHNYNPQNISAAEIKSLAKTAKPFEYFDNNIGNLENIFNDVEEIYCREMFKTKAYKLTKDKEDKGIIIDKTQDISLKDQDTDGTYGPKLVVLNLDSTLPIEIKDNKKYIDFSLL